MIKKHRVRLLAFLTVMLLSMTVFSSVALADGNKHQNQQLRQNPPQRLRP